MSKGKVTSIRSTGQAPHVDLTDRLVGITMAEVDLKSAIGLHPKFPLRKDGIYQLFGKVFGHAPIGVWLELHWVGKPKPPGGVQHFEADRMPAFLIQWSWVITMTLHRASPDPDEWLQRQLDTLEEPLS